VYNPKASAKFKIANSNGGKLMSLLRKLFGKKKQEETPAATPIDSPSSPEPLRIIEITPQELMSQLRNGNNPVVVDMRSQWEYQAGHIPGAINMFIQEIPTRFYELPKNKPLVFQCWHGNTSLDASSFLIQNGWSASNVASLRGGIAGWVQVHGQGSLEKE
jgi:rhodanese-related sulfurtransferase